MAANDPVLTVDLYRCIVTAPGGQEIGFEIAPDRKAALLEGLDETSLILRYEAEIDAFRAADKAARPWLHMR
jgi:3-isopropylmalate/(R)-2-methylmalate dehydratase small subunit